MPYSADIKKIERRFVPEDFSVTTWDNLEPFFTDLADRPLSSGPDLE